MYYLLLTAEDEPLWQPAQTWPEATESIVCMVLVGFVLWLVYKFFSGR